MANKAPQNVTNASDVSNTTIVCYAPTMITTNGIWQGDNPLDYSLPLFILQLTLVVVTTRIFVLLLKPFRQPRVISEILVTIIISNFFLMHCILSTSICPLIIFNQLLFIFYIHMNACMHDRIN